MDRRSLHFGVYACALAGVAVVGFALVVRVYPFEISWLFLMLIAAVVAAELLAVNLRQSGWMSLTYPIVVSGIVLLGPVAGALLAAAANLPYLTPKRIRPVSRTVFNASQLVLMALVPGVLFMVSGGQPLARHQLTASSFGSQVVPLLLAAWVGVVVNLSLVAGGFSLREGVSLRQMWRQAVSWMLPSQCALGLLGLAIGQVLADQGPQGFALFIIPLLVARQMYQRTLGLREAYADTVRSLVAAIEAKDPYTKGHSERVADYTTQLARTLSLPEDQLERLEIAALLHDLGKIGIRRSVLAKPERLTDEEYAVVKQHPDIGARILESVPFLNDLVPIVQGHHERFDGGGYGQALRGEHIPLGARILAVADSYDAMTTERPYRPALSEDVARTELVRGRGTQFDADVVDAFLETLGEQNADDPSVTLLLSAAEEVPYA